MGLEAQGPHVRIGNLLPRLVARGIQERLDFESAPRGGAANEVHHRFETDQRPPLPVQADEREEAMLNLVPLTRARWVMADDDRESQMVRETLQVNFPRPQPVPVAALPHRHRSAGARPGGYAFRPSSRHQRLIPSTANSAVSWVIPTLTSASSRATSYV